MDKIAAFITYQWAYGNIPISDDFYELKNYMTSHHLILEDTDMIISGRVCNDLKVGDVLVSTKDIKVCIKKIHTYGHFMESIDVGMTCGIIVNSIRENFSQSELLFKVKA